MGPTGQSRGAGASRARGYEGRSRDREAGSAAIVLKPGSRRAELTWGSAQVRELRARAASAPGGPSPRRAPAGEPRVTGGLVLAVAGSRRRDDTVIQTDADGFVCSSG